MRLLNVGDCKNIHEFVEKKLNQFTSMEKTFRSLFMLMHQEESNVFCEYTDGYKIIKVTYLDFKNLCFRYAHSFKGYLSNLDKKSYVGIYMENSLSYLATLWAILINGYNPLLLNLKLGFSILDQTLQDFQVKLCFSDSNIFSVNTIIVKDVKIVSNQIDDFSSFGEEIVFMSSGTNGHIKLCAFDASNFYYQIGNSVDIINQCAGISKHYDGELKLLTILPFYHVFGFIAVYVWFTFFSRTLVLLKDLSPKTIQYTILKHKVTHIFAVPLVFDLVYKKALKAIKDKGQNTYDKFKKGLSLSNKSNFLNKVLKSKFKEVRDNLFGESVQFIISGGGFISKDTLSFFNGIGYTIVNGYGMTEVGITSVEVSNKVKTRNQSSIGHPFTYTEYSINEQSELLIKGPSMARYIYMDGVIKYTKYDEWFNTHDLCCEVDGRYFLLGRSDDLIVLNNGENLNPLLIESFCKHEFIENVCLVYDSEPILIVSVINCYTANKLNVIKEYITSFLQTFELSSVISNIVYTNSKLLGVNDFKLSRKNVLSRLKNNEYVIINDKVFEEDTTFDMISNELKEIISGILSIDISTISSHSDFMRDLGASSLEYFMISDEIQQRYDIDIKNVDGRSLSTIEQIKEYICK